MAKKPPGMTIMLEHRQIVEMLTREEAGDVFVALFRFLETGETPDLEGTAKIVFVTISNQIKRSAEKYEKSCEIKSIKAKAQWERQKSQNNYGYPCSNMDIHGSTGNISVTEDNLNIREREIESVSVCGAGSGKESGGKGERGAGEEGAEGKGKPQTLLSDTEYTAKKKSEALNLLNER